MSELHASLTAIHRPYAGVYADATARLAATGFIRALGGGTVPFDSTDLYKKALQLDNASEWVLTAVTPTWVQVGGSGLAPTAHAASHQNGGSDEINVGGLSGVLADPQVPITENVQDIIGALLVAGTNITITYNDGANTLTIDSTGAGIGGSTGASDNRILRADGAGGATVQASAVSIGDNGDTLPVATSASDLGGASNRWKQFWADDIIASGTGAAGGRIRFFGSDGGAAEIGSNANRKSLNFTDGINGNPGTICLRPHTPSQFVANQNDYTEEGGNSAAYFRWSSDASRDVTGLSISQADGDIHVIINVGSNDIVLKHESASSSAVNRFLCSTGADITLSANQSAEIWYDGTTQRWRAWKKP